MKVGDQIRVMVGTSYQVAEIVKMNDKTVWVRLNNGATIKRHLEKHVKEAA